MSWSTFVIGYLRLAGDIDEKTKKQILADFEEALETAPEYKEKTGEYKFEDLNWSSHVEGEKIHQVFEKWKDYIDMFALSLYYLDEADYSIYYTKPNPEFDIDEEVLEEHGLF